MDGLILWLGEFTKIRLDICDEVLYTYTMIITYDKYRFCIDNGRVTHVIFQEGIIGHIKNRIHCLCIFYANNLSSYEFYLTTWDGTPIYTATIDYNNDDYDLRQEVEFSLLDVLTDFPRKIFLFYQRSHNNTLSFFSGTVIIIIDDHHRSNFCLSTKLKRLTMIEDVYVLCEEEKK